MTQSTEQQLKDIEQASRRAQVVPQVEVTDCMALAFHNAVTDGPIGEDDFNDIKTGLRAALAAAPQPPKPKNYCELCQDNGGYYYGRNGEEPCCI